jgi:hypothetical protein
MIKFPVGAAVRQVVQPITGTVTSASIIDSEVVFEVAYTGADGEAHSRVFTEAEIEADVTVATVPAVEPVV